MIGKEIDTALCLDLSNYQHYHRDNGDKRIPITKAKTTTSKEHLLILILVARWGFISRDRTYSERMRILRAASRMIAYDNGYQKEFSIATVQRWQTEV